MRNRAKCKLCNDVLESFHQYDYVVCKCGEISVDGGLYELRCSAKHWSNFLRVDDNNNEIVIKVKDEDPIPDPTKMAEPQLLTKQDKIEMLETMVKNIENLPKHAMDLPINHYDFYSYLLVIVSILKSPEKE